MSNPSGPPHRNVSNIRPGHTGSPTSPHTPLRPISSVYGSPSALRAEEECVVIELGSRYLRAGFAGEAVPKAVIDFGPEEQRRAGDYRQWQTNYYKSWRDRIQGKGWGDAHELWTLDLREVDLGLVGDKIERAIRDAYTKLVVNTNTFQHHADHVPFAGIYSSIHVLEEFLWLFRLPYLCRFYLQF